MTTMRQSGHVLRALLLTNQVERHCAVLVGQSGRQPWGSSTHGVAVCVAAGDGVGLVEQVVADFACQQRAQAVEVRLERRQLLGGMGRPFLVDEP